MGAIETHIPILLVYEDLSGQRDSNARHQPWQGCALPLSYARSTKLILVLLRYFIQNLIKNVNSLS